MNSIYNVLHAEADKIKIIDTHEHLNPYKGYLGITPDVLNEYLSHYLSTDLLSAGMPQAELTRVKNPAEDIEKRYAALEPYLDATRNGSYYRAVERGAQIVHGIETIDRSTIGPLNEKFKAAATEKGYIERVMRDVCNIDRVVDHFLEASIKPVSTDLVAPVILSEQLTLGAKPEEATLDGHMEKYREVFAKRVADGAAAVKLGTAYRRPIRFEEADHKTAAELYVKYRSSGGEGEMPISLEDYMFHYIFKCADEIGLPVQIHTGLQEGMGNYLPNSNPMLLQNLFNKYPNINFDIFHMGYPYERELITLAKTHANVFIDLCWAHILSPYASRAAFAEMLDVLPYTKIFGFGGDYLFYDGVAGHLAMAKENICAVLAEMVLHRDMSEDLAVKVLHAVFRENAKRVFKL